MRIQTLGKIHLTQQVDNILYSYQSLNTISENQVIQKQKNMNYVLNMMFCIEWVLEIKINPSTHKLCKLSELASLSHQPL